MEYKISLGSLVSYHAQFYKPKQVYYMRFYKPQVLDGIVYNEQIVLNQKCRKMTLFYNVHVSNIWKIK